MTDTFSDSLFVDCEPFFKVLYEALEESQLVMKSTPGSSDNRAHAAKQRHLVEQMLRQLDQKLPPPEISVTLEHRCYLALIQQVDALTQEWSFTFEEAANVFAWGAAILLQQKRYVETEHLLRRALVIWERTLGAQDALVGATVYNLALLNEELGNDVKAEILLQRAILARVRVSRADSPEIVRMLLRLARVYTRQHEIQKAELTYQKALALCAQGIGSEHQLTVALQYNLANLYLENDERFPERKAAEAEFLLRDVISFCTKKLGEGHLKTARALHKLALVSLAQQHWAEAEMLLQRVHSSYEQHMGAEQQETIEVLYQLAFTRAIQQKWDQQTIDLLSAIGFAYTHTLGPDDARTLEIYGNLALVYRARQQWNLVEPLFQYIVTSYERTLGPDHLDTGRALHSLAEASMMRQHWEQAEALFERALAIYEKTSEPIRLEVLNCLQQMVLLYQHEEQFSRVIELQQRIRNIWEELVEEKDTPAAVVGLNGQAELLVEQARFVEAEQMLRRALAICQHRPEVGLIVLAFVLQNMARAYSGQNKVEQAGTLFRRAAAIRVAVARLQE